MGAVAPAVAFAVGAASSSVTEHVGATALALADAALGATSAPLETIGAVATATASAEGGDVASLTDANGPTELADALAPGGTNEIESVGSVAAALDGADCAARDRASAGTTPDAEAEPLTADTSALRNEVRRVRRLTRTPVPQPQSRQPRETSGRRSW
jgi:hypothetical protein